VAGVELAERGGFAMSDQMKKAALAYTQRLRWPVFPLWPRTKNPATKHGFKDATLDEQQIIQWWTKWPNANIGIPTGIHFWVFDIDPRHGGDFSLQVLVHRYGALADTIQQLTGGGGRQYLYQMPDQQKLTCHTGLWPGIDIKGQGGYIVVPPSIHPSGKAYQWDTTKSSILEESLEPASGWLIKAIAETIRQNHSGEPVTVPEGIPKGRQHTTLFKLGCAMRAKGFERDEIFAALWAANEKRCEEPGPRENIERLAFSICSQYAAGQQNPPSNGQPAHAEQRPDAGTLITRCVADIAAEPIRWLWPHRIPQGKLSILAGIPGLGKSQVTAGIAAVITRGERWPVDQDQASVGSVVFLTAEDAVSDTLRPRLEAAGADINRIYVVDGVIRGYAGNGNRAERMFSLQEDLEALDQKLTELEDVVMVVIDPISAYLGKADSHKNAEVRAVLAPVAELASKHKAAFLAVTHLNKNAGPSALMRVTGSLAFVAAARTAWLVADDREDKTRRLFLPLKNNLAPDREGLAFRIQGRIVLSPKGEIETSYVMWDSQPVSISADEAICESCPPRAKLRLDAMDWLAEILAAGPLPSAGIFEDGRAAGFSEKTLYRAKSQLKIRAYKDGSIWMWNLPAPKY
jgi:hypothetical protein